MRPRSLCLLLLAAALLAGAGCGGSGGERTPALPPARALPVSSSSHVVVLVMENKERGDVVGAPASRYVNALARRYAIATSSYAVTHPSLPNYLALTSGSTQGITSDCTDCHVAGRNIVDELEAAHLSWKAYMEGLPSPCSQDAEAGRYAKKHDPFMYYDDVARNPRRCRRVVGFGDLAAICGAARCRSSPSSRPTSATTPTTATSPPATASSRASSPSCCASWARGASSS